MTFNLEDVAERYAVHPNTVSAWIEAGELAAFSVSKSARSLKARLRISESALAEFEVRRTVGRQPESGSGRRNRKRGIGDGDYIQFYRED